MSFRCIVFLSLLTITGAFDPCVDHFYLHDTGGRSPSCRNHHHSDHTITPYWYRLTSLRGTVNMTSSAVQENSCGAAYPIWMRDAHPLESDGIVNSSVCVSSHGSTCYHSFNIQVKNCSRYYVYHLIMTDRGQRYCFNSDSACPPPPTTTTTTTNGELETTTTNLTIDIGIPPQSRPTSYGSYSLYACGMFLGGFLIGALFVCIIVMVRAKRTVPLQRPNPPARVNLPPSYIEAVGGATAQCYQANNFKHNTES